MKLQYIQISQAITGVLAYKLGFAIVSLADKRVAIVSADVLESANLSPAHGAPDTPLHVKMTAMREGLLQLHAVLKRDGKDLYVTRLSARPVETLKIDEQQVDELCGYVASGGKLSREMLIFTNALRLSRNPVVRAFYERFKDAEGRAERRPGMLMDMRAQLQTSLLGAYV